MPDRKELERHWKERWRKAKLDLESARAHVLSFKDHVSSGLYGPDGDNAYQAAMAGETAALIEYSRVLRIYTDLVVHGKLPNEQAQGETAT